MRKRNAKNIYIITPFPDTQSFTQKQIPTYKNFPFHYRNQTTIIEEKIQTTLKNIYTIPLKEFF